MILLLGSAPTSPLQEEDAGGTVEVENSVYHAPNIIILLIDRNHHHIAPSRPKRGAGFR